MLQRVLGMLAVWVVAVAVVGSLVRASVAVGEPASAISLAIALVTMVLVVVAGRRGTRGQRTPYW